MSVPLGPLCRVVLDEPIGVWFSRVESSEVVTALDACRGIPREGTFTIVLWPPVTMPWPNVRGVLERAGSVADTLVLVASDEDRLRWGALGTNDLCATARKAGAARVLVEPDPKRAVVGAMQWLRARDAFCAIGPREQALERFIALGAAWRGSWDEPENGEFHDCPRGPEDLFPHPRHATEDRSKPGEDR